MNDLKVIKLKTVLIAEIDECELAIKETYKYKDNLERSFLFGKKFAYRKVLELINNNKSLQRAFIELYLKRG